MPELCGGRRASRGRRPVVLYRARHRVYYLAVPGRRFVLTWSPWRGYVCDAVSVIVGGKVVSVVYYT